jgi:hypothetical protein
MNKKNVAKIAIFLILLTCLIGAVNASEDVSTDTINAADDQTITPETTHEDTTKETVSEPTKTVSDDTPKETTKKETQAKLKTTNTETQNNTNNNEDTTKTSTTTTPKDDKKLKAQNNQETLKSGTKTVDVNNYDELADAMNNATKDSENNEYIINLVGTSYSISSKDITLNAGTYKPNIIINGNGKTLTGTKKLKISINTGCNITIKDLTLSNQIDTNAGKVNLFLNNITLNARVTIRPGCNLYIQNSTFNSDFTNYETITISDDCIIGNPTKFTITESKDTAVILTNNTNIIEHLKTKGIYLGNNVITDTTISSAIRSEGNLTVINSTISATITNECNLTIINSTINAGITNNGVLIISDDTSFGSNCRLTGEGAIIINNTDRIAPYIQILNGNITIENATMTNMVRTNYGNLTIINSIIGSLTNYGIVNFKNSTITGTISSSTGTLIFDDDVTFSGNNVQISISNANAIIINDTSRIAPYLTTYYGNYILENSIINKAKTNSGNLTIINSTISATLTNSGNLTIINSTINAALTNNKDCNITLINSTVNKKFTNNGNLVFDNSTLTVYSPNDGKLTLKDSTVTSQIKNNGIIILEGDLTGGLVFTGTGTIIADDINRYFKNIYDFTGETIIELGEYDTNFNNYGNLTIENSTLGLESSIYFDTNYDNAKLVLKNTTINIRLINYGVMELTNVTVNKPIDNYGVLIISEDTIIGENFKINGNGEVISNNTQIIDFVTTYNGNIVLTNKTIASDKVNQGTLTLNNCTVNATIYNNGIIIIDEDTIFGENTQILGDGEIKINDIKKLLPYISTINGNYIITDTSLNKTYNFYGTVTLKNCTITSLNNVNQGILSLNNCTIDVGENNTFLTNIKTVYVSKDTYINGKINDISNGVIYEGVAKIYNINNGTIELYIGDTGLDPIIRPGDVLNFQGNILLSHDLIIDTPVNINSENAYLNGNQLYQFIITEDGAYTNITGISFNNTKILINAKYVTLENTNINGTIKLDGSNNTITNNKIITDDEYTITSTIGQNNTITDNYLVAKTFIGDKTVNLNDASNIIENNIPLNVKIEITVNPENTVNKTTTIIIVLKDENDNIIANQKVNLTIGSSTQEVELKNGFLVYTYTPENIGEDAITIKYTGDNTYLPTTNTSTINITANKDQIIEELNQEILDKNETIHNQEDTIQNQNQEILDKNETITALNNTVKAQDTTIKTQTETIQKQDTTIQTQKQEINTANNKLATAEQQASQATVPIKTVKAAKTVKKSKKYTIKVSLKKAVKGKKVFVIFNGKTYTKKTNKKGIATITIPKSVLKKLGGKKIKYQIISGEKIVKKSVKVKK